MLLESIAIDPRLKAGWEAAVNGPRLSPPDVAELVSVFRQHPPTPAADAVDDERLADALWASVVTARVAFALPEAGLAAYDRLAELFLDGLPLAFSARALGAAVERALADPARLNPELLPALWAVIEGGVGADITPRVAALGAAHPPALRDAALSVRPGITSPGALEFLDEAEQLARAADPQREYIDVILPRKVQLAADYAARASLGGDLRVLGRTLRRLLAG